MGISFKQENLEGKVGNVLQFWRGEAKVLPGGFKLIGNFTGKIIRKCLPIRVDFEKRTANLMKFVDVHEVSTDEEGRQILVCGRELNYFEVGDVVSHVMDKTKSAKIVSVTDFEEDQYVEIILDKELAMMQEVIAQEGMTMIFQSTEATESTEETEGKPAEVAFLPNAVVAADLEVSARGIPTIDAAYDALVLAPLEWIEILKLTGEKVTVGNCLGENPNIMFITQ